MLYKKTSDANWTTISNVTANPYTLTNLDYATEYEVKIQAVCGGDDESEYSGIATFTSACTSLGVPWVENFESTPEEALATCWNTNGSTAVNSPAADNNGINAVWGTHEHNSNHMARMAAFYTNTSAPRVAILNSPQIVLPSAYSCELTFDYANNMYFEYSNTPVPVSLILNISTDGGATWTQLGTYEQSSAVEEHKDDNENDRSVPTILTTDPITFLEEAIDLTLYKGETIILQFLTNNPQGNSEGAAFVDNVEIHRLTDCKKPTNVHCISTETNSATVDWTAGNIETDWLIQYSRDGILWSEEIDVTEKLFTLTQLSPGTFYYVRVMAECSATETSQPSNLGTFQTQCGPLIIDDLPWSYNFDYGTETGSGNIPNCWRSVPYTYADVFEGDIIYPYVKRYDKNKGDDDEELAYSHKQHLKFYGGDGNGNHRPCIILPQVDEEMHGLTLNFWHKERYTGDAYPHFTVGYLRDGNDLSSFVAVESVGKSESYTFSSVSFANIADDDVHFIAIRWDGGTSAGYGWIDDLELLQDLYIFDNIDGGDHRWDNPLNWNKHAVPSINDNVFIRAAAEVNEGTKGTARSVVIDRKTCYCSRLDIMPGGSLVIATTLRQKNDRSRRPVDEQHLAIHTSASGNGVLAVKEHDGTNRAIVNFYTKACKTQEDGYVNQFIGTPFNSGNDLFVDYYGSYMYKYEPDVDPIPGKGNWVNQVRGTPSVPFAGYNILR